MGHRNLYFYFSQKVLINHKNVCQNSIHYSIYYYEKTHAWILEHLEHEFRISRNTIRICPCKEALCLEFSKLLGAAKDDIPLLWIAAPLTGLLVQPIIGYMSDRTWQPYIGTATSIFFNRSNIKFSSFIFCAPFTRTMGGSWIFYGF